jgi:hypothetical protein
MTVREIEFAGHLPVFEELSNVGTHPLMNVFDHPPDGYRFVQTPVTQPSDAMVARAKDALRALGHALTGIHDCVTPAAINRFLESRHMVSQLLLPEDCGLALYPTFPMTFGQVPWMLEIEEATPLFHPYLGNGRTDDVDLENLPGYWMVRHLIRSDSCRAVLTHMRCTAETLPVLFRDESLAEKIFYSQLAMAPSDIPEKIPERDPDTVTFLFTNSWHQMDAGFFIRGGNDVLAAFFILLERHPNIRLILRTQLPARLGADVIQHIRAHPAITVYDEPVGPEQMDAIMAQADVHLIVSAHAHVMTALRAMAFGQALVVSDGWAIEEYAQEGENAVVVPGRAGKCWRYDADLGFFREKWLPLSQIDPAYVGRLVGVIEALVADRGTIAALGQGGRKAIEERYTLDAWNAGLKCALDAATA